MGYRRLPLVTALAIVALVFCAPAWAPPAPPPPLITNGDFEDATLTGWTVDMGGADLIGASGWTAESGTQSVELDSATSGASEIYQDVATAAGQRYDLSFAYAGDPTLDATVPACDADHRIKHLTVHSINSGASFVFDTSGHSTSDMGWKIAHVLIDATSSTTRINFRDSGDGVCGIALDNVSMGTPAATLTETRAGVSGWLSYGQAVTVTAQILGSSSSVVPTGAVQFEVDGTPTGDPVALTSGSAQLTTSSLSAGTHMVTATYQPDSASFDASEATEQVLIEKSDPYADMAFDPAQPVAGQPFTVAAAFYTPANGEGVPTGTVQFSDDLGPLGDPVPLDDQGIAAIDVVEPAGGHNFEADYAGDANYGPASVMTMINVDPPPSPPPPGAKASSRTKLTTSKSTVSAGELFTATATVAPSDPANTSVVQGEVQFSVNGSPVGLPVALVNGRAETPLHAPLVAGRTRITAQYAGNADFASSGGIAYVLVQMSPPVAAPADVLPPSFTLKPVRTRLGDGIRNGIDVRVDCSEICRGFISLSLPARVARQLGFRTKGARFVVARVEKALLNLKAYTLHITFSAKARKRLLKAKRLMFRLNGDLADRAGNHRTSSQTLTLKR